MSDHVNSTADSWNSQELLSEAYFSAAIRHTESDVFADPIEQETRPCYKVFGGADVSDDMPVSTA